MNIRFNNSRVNTRSIDHLNFYHTEGLNNSRVRIKNVPGGEQLTVKMAIAERDQLIVKMAIAQSDQLIMTIS